MTIGPNCPHCGTQVREQYYNDETRAFEVQAGVYHSAKRCLGHTSSELFAARLVVSACRSLPSPSDAVVNAMRLYD